MDYEQKYKKALERARKLYKEAKALDYTQDLEDYEIIFPELAESEDEKIPRLLHKLLCAEVTAGQFEKHGLTVDSALDWLEKQKPPKEWSQENIDELTHFESAMMHIGGSFFGGKAGLDPNNTVTIKEQAELLLKFALETEWSEDDKAFLDDIICKVEHDLILNKDEKDWLKSLKEKRTATTFTKEE